MNENGQLVQYGTDPSDYSTDVLATFARNFVAIAPESFLLYFAPFAPHFPPISAQRHEGELAALELPEAPSYREADVSDKPPYIRARKRALEGGDGDPFTKAWSLWVKTLERRAELETLLAVDEAVASILDALSQRGSEQRTVVIYTSDNGRLRGEHWSYGKNDPYEESVRVPLVMVYPGEITPGTTSDAVVANIDLAPTIADLSGVPIPASVEGVSLRPLFRKGARLERREILLEWWGGGHPLLAPMFHALRADGWKFVLYDDGFEELYDLRADPYELDNLAVLEPTQPKLKELRALLKSRAPLT